MSRESCPLQQIKTGFDYLAVELPKDPVVSELLNCSASADLLSTDAQLLVTEIFGSAIDLGRHTDKIRSDVPAEAIVEWIVEQLFLELHRRNQCVDGARTGPSVLRWSALTVGN